MIAPEFYEREIAAKKQEIIRLEEADKGARFTLDGHLRTAKGKTEYDIKQWEAKETELSKAATLAGEKLRHARMDLKSLEDALNDTRQLKIF